MGFSGLLTDRGGGGKKTLLPKICHTYPTTMKLGTVIPYLKKIQKKYESHDTPLELTSAIFNRESANFVTSRNRCIDCILIQNL